MSPEVITETHKGSSNKLTIHHVPKNEPIA